MNLPETPAPQLPPTDTHRQRLLIIGSSFAIILSVAAAAGFWQLLTTTQSPLAETDDPTTSKDTTTTAPLVGVIERANTPQEKELLRIHADGTITTASVQSTVSETASFVLFEDIAVINTINTESPIALISMHDNASLKNFTFLSNSAIPRHNTVRIPSTPNEVIYIPETGASTNLLIRHNTENGETSSLAATNGPEWTPNTHLIGWSSDNQWLYIAQPEETTPIYRGLWKVSPTSGEAIFIAGSDEVIANTLSVSPQHDTAIGLVRDSTPCPSCPGRRQFSATGTLYVYDLAANTSRPLESSRNKIITAPIISPDGKSVIFKVIIPQQTGTTTELRAISLNSNDESRLLGQNLTVHGLSSDSQHILVAEENEQSLHNVQVIDMNTGTTIPVSPSLNDSDNINSLDCGHARGYSCLYNN